MDGKRQRRVVGEARGGGRRERGEKVRHCNMTEKCLNHILLPYQTFEPPNTDLTHSVPQLPPLTQCPCPAFQEKTQGKNTINPSSPFKCTCPRSYADVWCCWPPMRSHTRWARDLVGYGSYCTHTHAIIHPNLNKANLHFCKVYISRWHFINTEAPPFYISDAYHFYWPVTTKGTPG